LTEALIYDDFTIPPLKQDIDSNLQEYDHNNILKCIISENIVGSVRGFVENDTCFISILIVNQNYQNQGIGQMLMNDIESSFP